MNTPSSDARRIRPPNGYPSRDVDAGGQPRSESRRTGSDPALAAKSRAFECGRSIGTTGADESLVRSGQRSDLDRRNFDHAHPGVAVACALQIHVARGGEDVCDETRDRLIRTCGRGGLAEVGVASRLEPARDRAVPRDSRLGEDDVVTGLWDCQAREGRLLVQGDGKRPRQQTGIRVTRAGRPSRSSRSGRPGRNLPGCKVSANERAVPHVGRSNRAGHDLDGRHGIVLQLRGTDAVPREHE
jgi:hypothetical protein